MQNIAFAAEMYLTSVFNGKNGAICGSFQNNFQMYENTDDQNDCGESRFPIRGFGNPTP